MKMAANLMNTLFKVCSDLYEFWWTLDSLQPFRMNLNEAMGEDCNHGVINLWAWTIIIDHMAHKCLWPEFCIKKRRSALTVSKWMIVGHNSLLIYIIHILLVSLLIFVNISLSGRLHTRGWHLWDEIPLTLKTSSENLKLSHGEVGWTIGMNSARWNSFNVFP